MKHEYPFELDPLDEVQLPVIDDPAYLDDYAFDAPAQAHPAGPADAEPAAPVPENTPRPPRRYAHVDKSLILEPLFRAGGGRRDNVAPYTCAKTATGYISYSADLGVDLNADDQTLFFAILELIRSNIVPHAALPPESRFKQIFAASPLQALKMKPGYGALATNFSELSDMVGMSKSTNTNRSIMRSLRKLGAIQFVVSEGKRRYPIQLIDWLQDGYTIYVGIHPEIAYSALVHTRSVRYDMTQRLELKSKLAQVLHTYISGRLHEGHHFVNGVKLDTIVDQVIGRPTSPDQARKLRDKVKIGLKEVNKTTGWEITFSGRGEGAKAYIKRGNTKPVKPSRSKPQVDLERGEVR